MSEDTINPQSVFDIIPPSFILQRKIGGKASRLITPDAAAKSQAYVDELRPPIQKAITLMLEEIARAARVRGVGSMDLIWAKAHEIRGLAGSVKRVQLGRISDILCHYLNNAPTGFLPDPNLITTVTVAALHTLRENADADVLVETLVNDCAKAASVQRRREGRGGMDI